MDTCRKHKIQGNTYDHRHRTTQYNINDIKEEDGMTDKKLHKLKQASNYIILYDEKKRLVDWGDNLVLFCDKLCEFHISKRIIIELWQRKSCFISFTENKETPT